MNKFKLLEKLEQYKYEAIAVIGLLGLVFINDDDPLSTLGGLIMLFGMFGMLAKTISPTVKIVLRIDDQWYEAIVRGVASECDEKVIEGKKGADDD